MDDWTIVDNDYILIQPCSAIPEPRIEQSFLMSILAGRDEKVAKYLDKYHFSQRILLKAINYAYLSNNDRIKNLLCEYKISLEDINHSL